MTRRLGSTLAAQVFDADAVVRELLETDEAVIAEVIAEFGPEAIHSGASEGGDAKAASVKRLVIDRAAVREVVFRDAGRRRNLEAILHPIVRARWLADAERFRQSNDWLLVDLPLLFETSAESAFDAVAVVACSAATQRRRIVAERGLSGEMADRIIVSQENLALKMAKASQVVWNDAPLARLDEQTQIFAGYLQERYG